jgi:GIY-YIG catalytic domain
MGGAIATMLACYTYSIVGGKDTMNKPKYIYCLRDPRTMDIRYVGVTENPVIRLRHHWCNTEGRETHRGRWIQQLRNAGSKPIMEFLEENIPIEEWPEREMYWIAKCRSEGCPLTNSTDGGVGVKAHHKRALPEGVANKGAKCSEKVKAHWDSMTPEQKTERMSKSLNRPDVRAISTEYCKKRNADPEFQSRAHANPLPAGHASRIRGGKAQKKTKAEWSSEKKAEVAEKAKSTRLEQDPEAYVTAAYKAWDTKFLRSWVCQLILPE